MMKPMERFKNSLKSMTDSIARTTAGTDEDRLLSWLGIADAKRDVLSEVTYFTCLKVLAETLGKMPVKFYQDTAAG